MDPNTVVLEISSDEEGGWNDHAHKGIIDGGEGYNWISDILDEVNRDNCGRYDDDSDDVVVVSEVLPKKPRKKLTQKSSPLIDFDDDCVVLEHDPDKPPELRNNNNNNINNPIHRVEDDDSDDIVVVSEKGQVACRDYPHPRHLCIKFPFASTPNQTHCDQCYCYVCDTLAPCIYWGNGNGPIDHCLATDQINYWVLERKNSKNVGKEVSVPPVPQTPSVVHSQTVRPNPVQACPVTSSLVATNIINQDRAPVLARSMFQSALVSQQLTRASSCTIPGDGVRHSNSLAIPVNKPVFKRTASDGFATTTNRYSYSSYYTSNYRNHFTDTSQPDAGNTSVPFSPMSNTPFEFQPNFPPLVNSDPYVEVPVLFQPNPAPSSSQAQAQAQAQGKSSLPSCTFPSEASRQESQRSTVDQKFFSGISWPKTQIINQQPAAQSSALEGVVSTNEPSLASASGCFVDYEYDNWTFNNLPESVDGSGPFGLSGISPDPAFLGSGTLFDF